MNMSLVKKEFIVGIILVVLGIFGFFIFGGNAKNTLPYAAVLSIDNYINIATSTPNVDQSTLFHYIEIIDGCGPYYNTGLCVNMRSGPGIEYPAVVRMRTGVVLKVEDTVVQDGMWYKIIFDKSILYPERVTGDWYVTVDSTSVRPFVDIGDQYLVSETVTTTKRIVVELSKEMLYAYDGDKLFMQNAISTGLDSTPTAVGEFKVFKKTPSRYMQGPTPGVSTQYYDLPGVPWNLYFTNDGAVIHGAYWHDHFGMPWSHGCVNLPPEKAKELYIWADLGTTVTVKN